MQYESLEVPKSGPESVGLSCELANRGFSKFSKFGVLPWTSMRVTGGATNKHCFGSFFGSLPFRLSAQNGVQPILRWTKLEMKARHLPKNQAFSFASPLIKETKKAPASCGRLQIVLQPKPGVTRKEPAITVPWFLAVGLEVSGNLLT